MKIYRKLIWTGTVELPPNVSIFVIIIDFDVRLERINVFIIDFDVRLERINVLSFFGSTLF